MALHVRLGTGIVSVAVILIGAGVLLNTAMTAVSPVHAAIGPKMFPYAFGALFVVMGGLLAWEAWRGGWLCEATDPAEPAPDLVALGWVMAGLIANLLLIKVVGFILSSTLLYTLIAKGFGVCRIWLAALWGFVLAFVAYFGFAKLLGLRMGNGLIEGLF